MERAEEAGGGGLGSGSGQGGEGVGGGGAGKRADHRVEGSGDVSQNRCNETVGCHEPTNPECLDPPPTDPPPPPESSAHAYTLIRRPVCVCQYQRAM